MLLFAIWSCGDGRERILSEDLDLLGGGKGDGKSICRRKDGTRTFMLTLLGKVVSSRVTMRMSRLILSSGPSARESSPKPCSTERSGRWRPIAAGLVRLANMLDVLRRLAEDVDRELDGFSTAAPSATASFSILQQVRGLLPSYVDGLHGCGCRPGNLAMGASERTSARKRAPIPARWWMNVGRRAISA